MILGVFTANQGADLHGRAIAWKKPGLNPSETEQQPYVQVSPSHAGCFVGADTAKAGSVIGDAVGVPVPVACAAFTAVIGGTCFATSAPQMDRINSVLVALVSARRHVKCSAMQIPWPDATRTPQSLFALPFASVPGFASLC